MVRLYEDSGDEEDEIKTMTAFKMTAKDYRVWLCILGQVRRLNRAGRYSLLIKRTLVLCSGGGILDKLFTHVG